MYNVSNMDNVSECVDNVSRHNNNLSRQVENVSRHMDNVSRHVSNVSGKGIMYLGLLRYTNSVSKVS